MTPSSIAPFVPGFGRAPVFYGRTHYVEVIEGAMRAGDQPNRTVLIEGVRGSGKTALLLHLADRAVERGWDFSYVTSLHAADALLEDLRSQDASGRRVSGASLTMAGFGGSVSLERADVPDGPIGLRQAVRDHVGRSGRGLLILIDEMQKISRGDAQAICDAVMAARAKRDDVALVMAGLPGSHQRIRNFDSCTYMARSTLMFLTMLSVSETRAALRDGFGRVPELVCDEDHLRGLADFTKGHPYLVQLVGYHTVSAVRDSLVRDDARAPLP